MVCEPADLSNAEISTQVLQNGAVVASSDSLGQLIAEIDPGTYEVKLQPKAPAPFLVTVGLATESRLKEDPAAAGRAPRCGHWLPFGSPSAALGGLGARRLPARLRRRGARPRRGHVLPADRLVHRPRGGAPVGAFPRARGGPLQDPDPGDQPVHSVHRAHGRRRAGSTTAALRPHGRHDRVGEVAAEGGGRRAAAGLRRAVPRRGGARGGLAAGALLPRARRHRGGDGRARQAAQLREEVRGGRAPRGLAHGAVRPVAVVALCGQCGGQRGRRRGREDLRARQGRPQVEPDGVLPLVRAEGPLQQLDGLARPMQVEPLRRRRRVRPAGLGGPGKSDEGGRHSDLRDRLLERRDAGVRARLGPAVCRRLLCHRARVRPAPQRLQQGDAQPKMRCLNIEGTRDGQVYPFANVPSHPTRSYGANGGFYFSSLDNTSRLWALQKGLLPWQPIRPLAARHGLRLECHGWSRDGSAERAEDNSLGLGTQRDLGSMTWVAGYVTQGHLIWNERVISYDVAISQDLRVLRAADEVAHCLYEGPHAAPPPSASRLIWKFFGLGDGPPRRELCGRNCHPPKFSVHFDRDPTRPDACILAQSISDSAGGASKSLAEALLGEGYAYACSRDGKDANAIFWDRGRWELVESSQVGAAVAVVLRPFEDLSARLRAVCLRPDVPCRGAPCLQGLFGGAGGRRGPLVACADLQLLGGAECASVAEELAYMSSVAQEVLGEEILCPMLAPTPSSGIPKPLLSNSSGLNRLCSPDAMLFEGMAPVAVLSGHTEGYLATLPAEEVVQQFPACRMPLVAAYNPAGREPRVGSRPEGALPHLRVALVSPSLAAVGAHQLDVYSVGALLRTSVSSPRTLWGLCA
ncbi:unnamed protein product [Prorocentrum cordatum]|uniref:Uncharacterized protein n=1 Tax=Prorocentrum cordatum TaxID=2364126 RepID=A0ABN9WSA3_9DINO|nr:unnamed protein product [Polarella glacialis]